MTTLTMQARDDEQAGREAARLALVIGDELTACSLDVRSPDWDGSQFLKVTNVPWMLSQVSVAAGGLVEWERWPCKGRQDDLACTAATVLQILGGTASAEPAMPGPLVPVRCELQGRGRAQLQLD